MSEFDIDKEEIKAFEIDDSYLFKTHFDEEQLFKQLKKYYNRDKYRFEIPEEKLIQVQNTLDNYFYTLSIESTPEDYCIVLDSTADSSTALKNSVLRTQRQQQDILVMKDNLSAKQALRHGATAIEKSPINKEELTWKID
jgi:hypothetical protein